MLSAASGLFISSAAKDVQIMYEGVENCSQDVVRRITNGDLEITKMFVKTDVHPQEDDEAGVDWIFLVDPLKSLDLSTLSPTKTSGTQAN